MIRIAICDDSPEDMLVTFLHVSKYVETHSMDATITKFMHPDDLVMAIEKEAFDLYILDILMPMMNGVEVGRMIRRRDMLGKIVYLTSDAEFALESFQTYPFNYLLKPVRKEELYAVLDAFAASLDTRSESVDVKTKDGLKTIPVAQILYLEYLNHTTLFHLTGGQMIRTTTMVENFSQYTQAFVDSGRFARPHASYVVNLQRIRNLNKNELEMEDGSIIQVSRSRSAEIKEQYTNFLRG